MSDSDDFQISADEEDYDFEYDDEDDQLNDDSTNLDAENKYYNAKAEREDNPHLAADGLRAMIETEPRDSEWAFKAIKQLTKLLFDMDKKQELLEVYPQLFARMTALSPGFANRNYIEKTIQNLLDYTSSIDLEFMENMLLCTISGLKATNNERLTVRTNLRLANMYISGTKNYAKARDILEHLGNFLDDENETSVSGDKNNYTLEYYAAHIELAAHTGDLQKLRYYYDKALNVQFAAISHPRIMGIIRECGGQLHMREKKWSEAREDFFESFKNYDEAGSSSRISVLRYYVLVCMLSESGINPFESQETKPYKDNPEIKGAVDLVEAFQRSDIAKFEKAMKEHDEIMKDPFMKDFVGDLIKSLRSMSISTCIRPYSRISLTKLASLVGGLSVQETVQLITMLILDERLPNARLDMVNETLIVNSSKGQISVCQNSSKLAKLLPPRYSENAAGKLQQQEQQSLVTDSSMAMSVASGMSRATSIEKERYQMLEKWTKSTQVFHELMSSKPSSIS